MRPNPVLLRITVSVVLWLPALLAVVLSPARGEEAGEITVLEDVLPAPCPTLLPTPDGRRVVCVQPVPQGFQWREKFPGKPLVRVAVVDLDARALLAVRDFDPAALRFAVGKDALYVVNNDSLELQALSLADLGVMKSIQVSEPIEELYVIADRLLCDMRSRFRLDLPELTPSETWRVVPPLVGRVQIHTWSTSLDGLFRSRGPAAIFRAGRGWHIDGVLYDEELRPQLILDRAGPTFDPSEYWSPESAQYIQEYSWKIVRASREYPVSIMAVVPREVPPAELPVTLRLVETGSSETLAEVEAGALPATFVVRRGLLLGWNEEALIKTDGLSLKAEDRIDIWPIGKQKNVPISIGIAGNRALAAFNGNLVVWDVDRELLEGALGPQRLVQKQSQLLVDISDTTTLTHELIQPGTGRIAVNEITLDGKSLVNETVVRRLMRDHNLRNGQDIQRYLDWLTPQFLRLVGRPPRGLVGAHKIAFTAEGTKSAIRYTVLFEIPEDVYGPYFRAEVQRVAQRAERNRAASEPQRRAQRAAADARQQQRDAEFRWNLIAAFLSSPYVLIPIVLGVMAVGWRTRAPLLNGLAGAGRRVRGAGVRNRVSGLIGIVLGGAILLSFWMKGGPEGAGAYAVGQIIGLIMGALMFFGGFYYLFKGSSPVDQRSATVPEPVLERSREGGDVPATDGIWETSHWVIAVQGDNVYRQQFNDPAARVQAAQRLAAGESPQAAFGRSGQRLPLGQIRGLAWVPAVRTVLIYLGWGRGKWRLTFDDETAGEHLFQTLAVRLPGGAGPAVECPIGPDDLHVDPRFGVGFFLAIVGLFAIAKGALDGVGEAQYTGPGARWVRTFELLGAAVGVGGAIAIGLVSLAAGVFGLVWWYRNRPLKWMVQRHCDSTSPAARPTDPVEQPQDPVSRTKLDQLEDAILKFTPPAGGVLGGLIAAGALKDVLPLFLGFVAGGAAGGLLMFALFKLLFLVINPKRDRRTG